MDDEQAPDHELNGAGRTSSKSIVAPMEAKLVGELPVGPGWQYEPKWDGFRTIIVKHGDGVDLWSKSGKPLSRYFPEIVDMIAATAIPRMIVDGELIIPIGETLSFDALQARLHPAASRIARLSKETPAQLMLFDCLGINGADVADRPLRDRREELERLHAAIGGSGLLLSPCTTSLETACGWLATSGGALDGVVAKRLDEPYRQGERAMLKVKQRRTADCVVGGFRQAEGGREVASLLLGLYDEEGRLDHVGFCSGIAAAERADLTARLDALVEAPARRSARTLPRGSTRWSRHPASTGRRPADPAAGTTAGRRNGSRFVPSWWSRCSTIR